MTGLKVLSLTPLFASFTLPDGMEKAGIIGLLCLAVGALWLDSNRRQSKLERIIDANAKATTSANEVLRANTAVLVELKKEVMLCAKWDGITERRGK